MGSLWRRSVHYSFSMEPLTSILRSAPEQAVRAPTQKVLLLHYVCDLHLVVGCWVHSASQPRQPDDPWMVTYSRGLEVLSYLSAGFDGKRIAVAMPNGQLQTSWLTVRVRRSNRNCCQSVRAPASRGEIIGRHIFVCTRAVLEASPEAGSHSRRSRPAEWWGLSAQSSATISQRTRAL